MNNPRTTLVKRLRSGHYNADITVLGGMEHDSRCLEAADRIEELEKALTNITTKINDWLVKNK